MSRTYTDAEKAAYYKKKANALARKKGGTSSYGRPISGRGAYRASRSRNYAAIRGRGAYKKRTSGAPLSTAAGGAIGGALGSMFGPAGTAAGTALGAWGGNRLGTIMGWGDYGLRRNSVMSKISEGNDPARMHTSKSELIVSHREYITDIISAPTANTFNLQAFPINPGLITSFPWLSAIATQFEEYELLGMVFEFKTLSADAIANTTNTALGYIVMATDYNSINPNFVNKQQMENTEYTTSCKPSLSMYHPIECDPGLNPLSKLYVRAGAVPANSDQRMYDLGVFQIATSCPGTNVVLGELWCTYEVGLKKPISTSALGQDVLTDHYKLGAVGAAHPIGQTSILQANSSIGGTINTAGTQYSFPSVYQEGVYLFALQVTFTAGVAITQPAVTVTNGTLLQMWANDNSSVVGVPNGTTSAALIMNFIVNITGLGCVVNFGTAGVFGTFSTGDLMVTQFDSNIAN